MSSPFSVFRKNSKIGMAALTLLAMFAFVVLDSFQKGMSSGSWFSSQGTPVVETSAGNLTAADVANLRQRRTLANRFIVEAVRVSHPDTPDRELDFMVRNLQFNYDPSPRRSVLIAHLLRKEAEKLGIVINDSAVEAFIDQFTQRKLSSAQFREVLANLGTDYKQVYDVLRDELQAKLTLEMLRPRMAQTPDQYWEFFKQLHVRQTLELAPVPVKAFVDQVGQPTKAELAAYFEQYKDREPNRFPDFGPGFFQPHKVKMQWLTVSFEEAQKSAKPVTDEEVVAHYEANKATLYVQPKRPDDKPLSPELTPEGEAATPEKGPSLETPADKPESPDEKKPDEKPEGDKKPEEKTPEDSKPEEKKPEEKKPEEKKPDGEQPAEKKDEPKKDAPAPAKPEGAQFNVQAEPVKEESAQPAEKPAAEAEKKEAEKSEPEKKEPEKKEPEAKDPEKPAAEKPADEPAKPAEPGDKPEGEKPEGEKPEGEKPDADKPETEVEEVPEYRELDDALKEEIRTELLSQRTREALTKLGDEIRLEMEDLRGILQGQRLKEGSQIYIDLNDDQKFTVGEPHITDPKGDPDRLTTEQQRELALALLPIAATRVKELGAKHKANFGESELISGQEMAESKVPEWQALTGAFELAFRDRGLYHPVSALHFLKQDLYVFWKVDDVPPHIPQLADPGIEALVLKAWELDKARPLAEKRAKELAEAAAKAGVAKDGISFSEWATQQDKQQRLTVTGDKSGDPLVVVVTPEFSWMREPGPLGQNSFNNPPPELSEVTFVEQAGEKFMEAVFNKLQEGEVGVAPNQDRSIFYVVQVQGRDTASPEAQAALRERFEKTPIFTGMDLSFLPGAPPQKIMVSPYEQLADRQEGIATYLWFEALEKQYAVRWTSAETEFE